jgi:thiamine pyrophosphokinase
LKFNFSRVICFCDFTGRLDHALCNLHTLYDECLSQVCTYLISSESITFLLRSGQNIIYMDSKSSSSSSSSSCSSQLLGKYCGFFPLGKPACVTTQGLKWNLNRDNLRFGTFVSSSNEFDFSNSKVDLHEENRVLVTTDEHLLWTMSIN